MVIAQGRVVKGEWDGGTRTSEEKITVLKIKMKTYPVVVKHFTWLSYYPLLSNIHHKLFLFMLHVT